MKKILIFSTAYLPLIGGAEIAVKEITERLENFEFDLICARIKKELPKHEKIGKVNVYRLGWGCFFDKYYLAFFGHYLGTKLHKKESYSAVWAIMASFGGFAAMFFKKKNPAVPFLLTLQEGDSLDYIKKRVGLFYGWFREIFRRADYIQTISNFLADWAKNLGAACPIEVIPNGVDFNSFQEAKNKRQKIREQLSIKPEEKIVITVSRLVPKNGVEYLIEAMVYLPENIKLLVAGDGPLMTDFKSKIQKLKLTDRVLMLGSVHTGEIANYLAAADVFARPSLSEGLGNAFLEAMAAGVPVIGTPVGGIPDFLIEGKTGLFCEVKNPQSLAEKIKIILADDVLYKNLIENSRRLIEEKYDWQIIAAGMEKIFNRIIK